MGVLADIRLKVRIVPEGFTKTRNEMQKLHETARRLGTETKRLSTALLESGKRLSANGSIINARLAPNTKKLTENQKMLTRATRRFRAEWLSLLFVGMAVAGMFNAYVQEALNLSGTNEILRASLGGAVMEFLELLGLEQVVDIISDWADENPRLAGGLLMAGFAAGKLLMILATISLIQFGQLMGSIKGMTTALKAAFFAPGLFTKISVVIAIIFLLFDAIVDLLDPMASKFDKIASWIQIIAIVVGLIGAIFFGWPAIIVGVLVATIAWLSKFKAVREVAKTIWELIKSIGKAIGNFFIGGLNKIGFNLSPFAEGGIVTRPTAALVGEAGPEAIIPLNKLANFAPNVTVNANVGKDVDISRLANALSNVYSEQLRSQGIIRRTI